MVDVGRQAELLTDREPLARGVYATPFYSPSCRAREMPSL